MSDGIDDGGRIMTRMYYKYKFGKVQTQTPEAMALKDASEKFQLLAHALLFADREMTPEDRKGLEDDFYQADDVLRRRLAVLTGARGA